MERSQTRGEVTDLRDSVRAFAEERDWDQYHSPKNLASALAVEAAEVMEHFQWLTEEASRALAADERRAVAEELADVFIYLISLADKLDVDLIEATKMKIQKNAEKYPVDKARGNSRKYTDL